MPLPTNESSRVTYDAQRGRYLLDNVCELPRVTKVLSDAGLINHAWYYEGARDRGVWVHEATTRIEAQEPIGEVPPEYAPYLEAYLAFTKLMQPEWSLVEAIVADLTLGYAGRLDRAGMIQGIPYIVDLKTGSVPPVAGPQTAAYKRCLPDAHLWQRAAVQLRADGHFRFIPLLDRGDEAVFLAALRLHHWRLEHVGNLEDMYSGLHPDGMA